ncbi:hypothetical protein TNCV_3234301 [Trichonephila clavipes]|nr:hypothetical protein TNCV_3234301 [Trichonephila clavipes]
MAARAYMWLRMGLTGQRYIDEVLLPHVCLFVVLSVINLFFMDDNATCHRTLAVQGGLSRQREYSTSHMASAFSRSKPHSKCVGCFGRQVAGRNYPPTNKNTLIPALTEEWNKLPPTAAG